MCCSTRPHLTVSGAIFNIDQYYSRWETQKHKTAREGLRTERHTTDAAGGACLRAVDLNLMCSFVRRTLNLDLVSRMSARGVALGLPAQWRVRFRCGVWCVFVGDMASTKTKSLEVCAGWEIFT